AHCPDCGAPETGGESDACEHCGEVLNDGSRDWVLGGVFSRYVPEGQAALAAVVSAPGGPPVSVQAEEQPAVSPRRPVKAACLAWLVQMMVADGQVDEKEREVLQGVAEKAGMRQADIDALVARASAGGADGAAKPADDAEARDWMDAM